MPGMMPNPNMFGGFLSMDRYNNNADPSQFNPYAYIDPMQAIAYQQAMAKQIFQMQNPRMALPQNIGQSVGTAINNAISGGTQEQGPQQPQQGAQTPAGQAVDALRKQYQQQGMSYGKALYTAANELSGSGKFDDPMSDQVFEHAIRYSQDKLKYNPDSDIETKAKIEAGMQSDNLRHKGTGELVAVRRGTPQWQSMIDSGQFEKASDMGNIPVGHIQAFQDQNGVTHYGQYDGEKYVYPSGKGSTKAGVPAPQRNMTLTGDDAKDAWSSGRPPAYGPEAANKNIEVLTNRSVATKNFLDATNLLDKIATPNSIGVPGDISEKASNIFSTVKAVAGRLGMSGNTNDYKMNWNPGLAKDVVANGIDAEKVKALMLHTAMLHEAIYGDKNATDSNRKFAVEQQLKILGEDSSSLPALHATLQQNQDLAVSQLNNEFEGKPNVMGKPQWLQQELAKRGQGGPNKPSSSLPKVSSLEEARALPPGTHFLTPDGREKVR